MSTEILFRFINAFEQLSIPYMLVGSYSSNVYGRPRSTQDADFVVQMTGNPMPALAQILGSEFQIDPQMSFETVTATMRYVATHPASAFKVEMFLLSDDAHDQLRFQRRQQVDFEGKNVWLPTPEDVVITKLRWSKGGNRSKDISDVLQILDLRKTSLALPYIRNWCDQHNTRELFEKLLQHVA
jgi:hypothetical protein